MLILQLEARFSSYSTRYNPRRSRKTGNPSHLGLLHLPHVLQPAAMASSPTTPAAKADAFMAELARARDVWTTRHRGLRDHVPQAGDVHIATYAKSGTTLLQHLTYQLAVAAGGAPAADPTGDGFPSLMAIAPWVEYSQPLTKFASSPRVFKTHMRADQYGDLLDDPKVRFVVCVRDGLRVPGSLLQMLVPWMLPALSFNEEDARATFDRFVEESFLQPRDIFKGGWFEHVRGWTKTRRPNVLVLRFEELIKDLPGAARRVVGFLGLDVGEEGIRTAVERCGKQRMADDKRFRETDVAVDETWDPEGACKVRVERGVFGRLEMRPEDREMYEMMLVENFEGAKDYGDLVKVIEKWQKGS